MPHIRDRGFTLIELMVVVIIIGILSVSVAFSVSQDSHRTALREAHRLATLL
jgi:general secretion pathway protein H